MYNLNLIDNLFNNTKTLQYHLSIQVDLNGVTFCILDPNLNKYIAFRRYTLDKVSDTDNLVDRLEKIVKEDDLLKYSYHTVSFTYLTQKSTLVPKAFFDISILRTYFEFNHTLDELDELHYNLIPDIESYNVFAIPAYVANVFYSKFQNLKFYHQATPFIKSIIGGFSEPSGIHINLNYYFFDIVVKQKSTLKIYNTFQYYNDTDLLYFVMLVVKQLNLDTKSMLLTLCGENAGNVQCFEALKNYFPNFSYFEPISPGFAQVFNEFDVYKYFTLFYQYHCES